MATIKATVGAWLSSDYAQQRFVEGRQSGDPARTLAAIALNHQDMTDCGWTRIGEATVTLEVAEDSQIRQNMVSALQEQKRSVLAKAQREAMQIEERIQNLLAISFDGSVS